MLVCFVNPIVAHAQDDPNGEEIKIISSNCKEPKHMSCFWSNLIIVWLMDFSCHVSNTNDSFYSSHKFISIYSGLWFLIKLSDDMALSAVCNFQESFFGQPVK